MLSYFPARDVEEPASKEFIEAQLAPIRARFDQVDARFAAVDARFDSVDARFDSVDARFGSFAAELRSEMADMERRLTTNLHNDMRAMTQWTIGAMFSLVALLVAVGFIVR